MTDASQAAAAATDLIAPGTSSQSLQQHVACFPRLKDTRPNAEHVLDLAALYRLVTANGHPAVYGDKSLVSMVLLGELKVAPYVGQTLKRAIREVWPSTTGKQRSSTHVLLYGPAIMFDIDGVPVENIERKLKALGLAYIVYTSFSSGEESHDKAGKVKAKGRGRLVLFLDSTWNVGDHERICRVIDRILLGGVADPGAFSRGQGFYIAGLKKLEQEFYHNASHGALLSLKSVLAQAPKRGRPRNPTIVDAEIKRVLATPDEAILQEAREIGAMDCIDIELNWFKMVNAIRRAFADRPEFALDVADAMSEAGDKELYKGRDDVAKKMDRDDGEVKTRFDYVQSWGKFCAVAIIERAHTQDANNVVRLRTPPLGTPSAVFVNANLPTARLADGIAPGMEAPSTLSTAPANVARAAAYLARWHSPHVIDNLMRSYPVLAQQHGADIEARKGDRVAAERALDDREEVVWDYENASIGCDNFVDGLLRWATKTQALWVSGDTIWQRVKDSYPERFKAVTELSDCIALTDSALCRKVLLSHDDETTEERYVTVEFPPTARNSGPDRIRLKIIMERLRDKLPKVVAFVDIPTFASLPHSYDSIESIEPHLVDQPGYDARSGLYLLRGPSASIKVSASPTDNEMIEAVTVFASLNKDFDFADHSSRLAALVSTMLAGTRGSLSAAPGSGAFANAHGQGGGKNTQNEKDIAIATGEDPELVKMTLGDTATDTNRSAFGILRERPRGLSVTNIDMHSGHIFKSSKLAELHSSGTMEGQVLYSMKHGRLQLRPFVTYNGNSVRLSSDFGSRILASKHRRPAMSADGSFVARNFTHPNLVRYVLENRPKIVWSILTLVMFYWRECQHAGGMPGTITALCAGKRSRFKAAGFDFLLDCTTWLTSGKYGSAYGCFASARGMTSDDDRDHRGRVMVERVMAEFLTGSTCARGSFKPLFNGNPQPPRPPVSQQHPARPDELWDAFGLHWPEPSGQRVEMGEIINSRSSGKGAAWGSKSLMDWLNGQEGLPGASTDVLHVEKTVRGRVIGYWFGAP